MYDSDHAISISLVTLPAKWVGKSPNTSLMQLPR